MIDCIHLVDALPELSFCMSMGIPADLDTANAYRQQFALMLEHTTKPDRLCLRRPRRLRGHRRHGGRRGRGHGRSCASTPRCSLYSEPSTPLKHSETATGKLLYMAEQALPIVHSPAPMMGGTAPVTLAGGLALGNAEVLSSLVMHQLKRPGAPFVYGSGLHHMDMKTTISVYGAPEFQLARVAVAEMGRFYGLPTWGYAGHSDSCAMDEQAAADAAFSVLVALLAGNNLVHDVGYLEAGLTTSPEMIVFTAEMISMMRRFMGGPGPGCRVAGPGRDPQGRSRRRLFDGRSTPSSIFASCGSRRCSTGGGSRTGSRPAASGWATGCGKRRCASSRSTSRSRCLTACGRRSSIF